MRKKSTLIFLSVLLVIASIRIDASSDLLKNDIKILVNEKIVTFPSVLYKEENYVKIRDLAYSLIDYKDFTLDYKTNDDGTKTIVIGEGKYQPKGDELKGEIDFKDSVIGNEKIAVGDKKYSLNKINVLGYNYFRLRDLAPAIGIEVSWDKNERVVKLNKVGEISDGEISFTEVKPKEMGNSPIMLVKDAGENKISITYSVKVNTGGYTLKTKSVKRVGKKIIITPDIKSPAPNSMVTQAISYPTTEIIIDGKELPEGYTIVVEGANDENGLATE